MVDLTQDTCILNKQQARWMNEKALPGGLKGAQEMGLVTRAKTNMVVVDGKQERGLLSSAENNLVVPSESSKQERGLVISAAARKKILEMALGQSVSTFSIFLQHFMEAENETKQMEKYYKLQSAALIEMLMYWQVA